MYINVGYDVSFSLVFGANSLCLSKLDTSVSKF